MAFVPQHVNNDRSTRVTAAHLYRETDKPQAVVIANAGCTKAVSVETAVSNVTRAGHGLRTRGADNTPATSNIRMKQAQRRARRGGGVWRVRACARLATEEAEDLHGAVAGTAEPVR